jgi:hypothetical protein
VTHGVWGGKFFKGPWEQGAGYTRTVHNEKCRNFYNSTNIILIRSNEIVTVMTHISLGEIKLSSENLNGRYLEVDDRILKWISKPQGRNLGTEFFWSRIGIGVGILYTL